MTAPEPKPPSDAVTGTAPRRVLETRGPGVSRAARDDAAGERPDQHLPVLVVGGGVAGLVAAYELGKRGVPVVVLEAADHAGGRAASEVIDVGGRRIVVHHGAQMSSPGYAALTPVVEELGLSRFLVPNTRLWSLPIDGQVAQFDGGDLFSTRGTVLGREDWWNFGQEGLLYWNRRLRGRSVADPAHWLDWEGQSGAWLERHLAAGPARLLNSIVHAFYFQRPEAVTRALALSLWSTVVDDLGPESLRDGFGMLVDGLVARIADVRLGSRVSLVESASDGVQATVDGRVLRGSDVVIATTADVAREIYPGATAAERALLDIAYAPIFNVILDVDADWLSHRNLAGTYGIWIPPRSMGADDIIASISIESGRKRQPTPGHETVQIMLDSEAAKTLLGRAASGVLERAVAEAERKRLLPGISRARRNYEAVFEIRSAIPETRPGRFEAIRRYEQTIDPGSRVKFAGDFRGFPRVGSAALSGVLAAQETVNAMRARAGRWSGPISPPRSSPRPSTSGEDLHDAVQGYGSAVARWGESVMRADLRGAATAWKNGWCSFFDGLSAGARAITPGQRHRDPTRR